MDWNLWILDKIFLVILVLIMMKLTGGMLKGFVMWIWWFYQEQMKQGQLQPGKQPKLTDAPAIVLAHAAPGVGEAIGGIVKDWAKGRKGGQPGRSK